MWQGKGVATGGPRCLGGARGEDRLEVDALLAVAGVDLQRALAGDYQVVRATQLDEARLLHHRLVLDRQAHDNRGGVAGEHGAVRNNDHLRVVHVGGALPVARQVAVEERRARLRLRPSQLRRNRQRRWAVGHRSRARRCRGGGALARLCPLRCLPLLRLLQRSHGDGARGRRGKCRERSVLFTGGSLLDNPSYGSGSDLSI